MAVVDRPAGPAAAPALAPRVWVDSAYAGQLTTWAGERLWLSLQTVSRLRGSKGFVVLPRRWCVERTIGWLMNARRNVRDYERLPQHAEAHLAWALITVMAKRLACKGPAASWTKKTSQSSPGPTGQPLSQHRA
ncbi:hypothetical protein [Streptomyces sp. 6N223]|uniref:hypothetical protein n=1 Tax=Streptomyces sp. 6N223 TaxID=3457412 RepID=UPI003FD243D1